MKKPPADRTAIPKSHTIVAVVIEWRGKIALLKRSQQVRHDKGLWHCVTGYVEPEVSPRQQALEELAEETGVRPAGLLELRAGPDLMLSGGGEQWLVHTFTAVISHRRLTIDWEHDAYRWITPHKVKRFGNRVDWLDSVLQAVDNSA